MDADTKKSIAALSSVIWSALLTAMKFVVGVLTGSLGLLSEALHSALDLLAAGGTLYAVKVAALPADKEHPYGHGKVENLMALGETILLLLTALWVIYEACNRLLSDDPSALHVETSVWAFVVVIVSLVVDVNRSAMLRRVAKETRSAALEADAAHFASDIWSSAAVLLGITGAAFADMAAEGSWGHWLLLRADVLASLVVAVLILNICRNLGLKTINNLMDKADSEAESAIRTAMSKRMPAYPVANLRVREVGAKAYVDMVVCVPRAMHMDTAHEIADAIEQLVAEVQPGAETMVHMHPVEIDVSTPEMAVRQTAITHRFGVHGLSILRTEGGPVIFADLELPADAILSDWKVAVRAFRSEVKRRLRARRVVVHIEPALREIPHYDQPVGDAVAWEEKVTQTMILMGAPLPTSVNLYESGDQRLCVVAIPPEEDLSVSNSHTRLTCLTKELTSRLPAVSKVVVTYSGE